MKKSLSQNSKLSSEWHSSKNGDLSPENFTMYSHAKVWWKCPKGDDHEWESTIANRSAGKGCPFCSGNRVSKTNNLRTLNPSLANEWHPSKNKDLKPENFTLRSNQKAWWKCPKGQDHEWDAVIASRSLGNGCPFCDGKIASKTNNLSMNSELLSEWHPTKNKKLKPEDFTLSSKKKVWWKCPKGEDHEWEAVINNRSKNKGTNCPICAGSGTSQQEIRILSELRYLFGSSEVIWRDRVTGVEIDIFLAKYNIGIEYDGFYWHKGKLQSDKKKNVFLQKQEIDLIRVREKPLQHISKNDIKVSSELTKNDLNELILKIKSNLKKSSEIDFDDYIDSPDFFNKKEFNRFISFLPSPPPEYSILNTHPKISEQWHYQKNSPLKPENFTSMSNKKVWWKCPKGNDHQWQARIANRSLGTNCPMCSGKKISKKNNLRVLNPLLANEWHPYKNGNLKPEDFVLGSGTKVWWKCHNGKDHEWKATINNRTKPKATGCPFCAGQKASKTSNLKVLNPTLAREWHPSKNGDFEPEKFRPSSNKKVWWLCCKNKDHEWQASINIRNRGRGCPICKQLSSVLHI